jgi:hypothetical protein
VQRVVREFDYIVSAEHVLQQASTNGSTVVSINHGPATASNGLPVSAHPCVVARVAVQPAGACWSVGCWRSTKASCGGTPQL